MLSSGQVKTGTKIVLNAAPYEITAIEHLKLGRGGAKLVMKLRNLLTQAVTDQTVAAQERFEEADISYKRAQFLYSNSLGAHCMLSDSFEQVVIQLTPERSRFLKDGGAIDLVFWQDQVIGIKLPQKVELEVTYTEPAVRGDTANQALKPATLETKATVMVPLFINIGDRIRLNTETGLYDSRA